MAVMPIVIRNPLFMVLANFSVHRPKGLDRVIIEFWAYRILRSQELRF